MTPSQLRAFHLVAEAGSFSAAARDSGLSQPNLSGQVTALEKAYGLRLFDRRGRSVVPTETGRQLQSITSRLFAAQEEAQALLAGEQALTRGHLRIAADSAHHVVPIMAALRKRAASLTFALSIDNSAIVLERLLRHEADVAVMAKSVSDPRLHAQHLRTDRVVLFVPARHALAGRRRVPLAALRDQELVLRERGSITREVVEQVMAAADIRPSAIVEVQTREGVREAVAAGFGIGAVFESELGDNRRFRAVAVADTDLDVAEYAVCLQERRRVALVRAFMEEAAKVSL
ncbi:MAG: LysR family transcriptional regulator [Reyranella sp.]|uniref:LysR substrate-binding domain-containing protein n=1 Tax=Reyranella sp. TaxID=1929291 RepID=UPI001ACC8514|nr:LysR substrate-binding domain-containing protein [Reyranella sp.]MBN9089481.1 LysR family transcriptional regulator [Reyranella sp.]